MKIWLWPEVKSILTDMKNKAGFWTFVGIGIAASVSVATQNIHAGLFIGGGSSMLLLIITNLEVDRKKRN
jgi:hypothetical protein